jgi:hypothetical protein
MRRRCGSEGLEGNPPVFSKIFLLDLIRPDSTCIDPAEWVTNGSLDMRFSRSQ